MQLTSFSIEESCLQRRPELMDITQYMYMYMYMYGESTPLDIRNAKYLLKSKNILNYHENSII